MIRIALRASLLAAASVAVLAGPVLAQTSQPQEARVMQILKRTPLIDGHNDLPWALRQGFGNDPHGVDLNANLSTSTRLHTDIPRLRAGGVGLDFRYHLAWRIRWSRQFYRRRSDCAANARPSVPHHG